MIAFWAALISRIRSLSEDEDNSGMEHIPDNKSNSHLKRGQWGFYEETSLPPQPLQPVDGKDLMDQRHSKIS